MAEFRPASWVWLPDEHHCYVPARVLHAFNAGQKGEVQIEEEEDTRKLSAEQTQELLPLNPEVLDGTIEDLIKFDDLTEQAILHNLRVRFRQDDIYTHVSTILVSVNPFKLLPLYTPDILARYKGAAGLVEALPPHVFGVGSRALRQMQENQQHQSIIISGESGAGKTEVTKLILQFLTDAAYGKAENAEPSDTSEVSEIEGALEQFLLQSNPMLEAFGNAKTVRNDNSSRFGKLMSVHFVGGTIVGGTIESYLLEKSRVVQQMLGERNYHIFYQLLASCQIDPALRNMLLLDNRCEPGDYRYTVPSSSDAAQIAGRSDEKAMKSTTDAMQIFFEAENMKQIVQVIGAVLHLGNVSFLQTQNAAGQDTTVLVRHKVGGDHGDSFDRVCELLGMQGAASNALQRSLCCRNIGTRSIVVVAYTPEQAADARDALAKFLYAAIFERVIERTNTQLISSPRELVGDDEDSSNIAGNETKINILDIFGFESLQTNSFEQLCINFCNEKLQAHFNQHIFQLELAEYAAEGVDVPHIAFVDNNACLHLLEAPTTGIFAMIDDELLVPKGSDKGFLSKLLRRHMQHTHMEVARGPRQSAKSGSRLGFLGRIRASGSQSGSRGTEGGSGESDPDTCFVVVHFAGKVSYCVNNFLDKCKDTLHDDIAMCLRHSSNPEVRKIACDVYNAGSARPRDSRRQSTLRKPSLGYQFKGQLAQLMGELEASSPHFIRCVKSNASASADVFESECVLRQLRYAGLLAVVRIRKLGFAHRWTFEAFVRRFAILLGSNASASGEYEATARAVLDLLRADCPADESICACGTTKVYLRSVATLEKLRDHALARYVKCIQCVTRRFLARLKLGRMKAALLQLQSAVSDRSLEALHVALQNAEELPSAMQAIKHAKVLFLRLNQEHATRNMLSRAIATCCGLESAIASVEALAPFEPPELKVAQDMLQRMHMERQVRDRAATAVGSFSESIFPLHDTIVELRAILSQATKLGIQHELTEAQALFKRLTACTVTLKTLEGAISFSERCGKDGSHSLVNRLDRIIDATKSTDHLPRDHPVLLAAQGLLDQLRKEYDGLVRDMDMLLADNAVAESEHERKWSLDNLEQVVRRAESAGLGNASLPTPYAPAGAKLTNLRALQQKRNDELVCISALKDALSDVDASAMTTAISRAGEIGLVCAEFDAVRAKLATMGAQSSARDTLAVAVRRGRKVAQTESEFHANIEHLRLALDRHGATECVELEEAKALLHHSERLQAAFSALDAALLSFKDTGLPATLQAIAECAIMLGSEAEHQGSFHASYLAAAKAFGRDETKASELKDRLHTAIGRADRRNLEDSLLHARKFLVSAGSNRADDNPFHAKIPKSIACPLLLAIVEKGDMTLKQYIEASIDVEADGYKAVLAAVDKRDLSQLNRLLLGAEKNADTEVALALLRKIRDAVAQLGVASTELKGTIGLIQVKAKHSAGVLQAEADALTLSLKRCSQLETQVAQVANELRELLASKGFDVETKPVNLTANTSIEEGTQVVKRIEEQAAVQARLTEAISMSASVSIAGHAQKSNEILHALQSAYGAAVELNLTFLDSAKICEETLEALGHPFEQNAEPAPPLASCSDEYENLDARFQAKVSQACRAKYHWTNFFRLRSVASYTRGIILRKKQERDSMLRWQQRALRRSLLQYDAKYYTVQNASGETVLEEKDVNRTCVAVLASIQGYCLDRTMSFPESLAHSVLQTVVKNPCFADDIYVLLLKQLTDCPKPESCRRNFQMLCMLAGTAPPSPRFELHLIHFLMMQVKNASKDVHQAQLGELAQFVLTRIQGTIDAGPVGFAPTPTEILAYNERPPVLAKVKLVDETLVFESLPVTPDMNVARITDICCHLLGVSAMASSDAENLSLFAVIEETDGDGRRQMTNPLLPAAQSLHVPLSPQPLKRDDYLGTVHERLKRQYSEYHLIFKRKIFLPPGKKGPSNDAGDPVIQHLNYLQATDDTYRGNIPCATQDRVVRNAAIGIAVDQGSTLAHLRNPKQLLDEACAMEYVPEGSWRAGHSEDEWAELILAQCKVLAPCACDSDAEESAVEAEAQLLRDDLQRWAQSSPWWGLVTFHARVGGIDTSVSIRNRDRLPRLAVPEGDIFLGIGSGGIHVIDSSTRDIIRIFPMNEVHRWNGTASALQLVLWDTEQDCEAQMNLWTREGRCIVGLIVEYIEKLLGANSHDTKFHR